MYLLKKTHVVLRLLVNVPEVLLVERVVVVRVVNIVHQEEAAVSVLLKENLLQKRNPSLKNHLDNVWQKQKKELDVAEMRNLEEAIVGNINLIEQEISSLESLAYDYHDFVPN
ncbi:MAG: hypothetical protein IBJ16_06890 [Chitinophagaceae bacterium]|nr:hypothetical protein [Chitinophagaceae bacterium]